MKVLLINQNPVIKKLVDVASKKLNLEVENLAVIPSNFNFKGVICIIVDDENVRNNQVTLMSLQNHIKVCLLFARKTEANKNDFNIAIQKPFLPTDILEILNQCMPKDGEIADFDSDVDLDESIIEPIQDYEKASLQSINDEAQAIVDKEDQEGDGLDIDLSDLDSPSIDGYGDYSSKETIDLDNEGQPQENNISISNESIEAKDNNDASSETKPSDNKASEADSIDTDSKLSIDFSSDLSDLQPSPQDSNPLDITNFDLDALVDSSPLRATSADKSADMLKDSILSLDEEALRNAEDTTDDFLLSSDERNMLMPSPKKFLQSKIQEEEKAKEQELKPDKEVDNSIKDKEQTESLVDSLESIDEFGLDSNQEQVADDSKDVSDIEDVLESEDEPDIKLDIDSKDANTSDDVLLADVEIPNIDSTQDEVAQSDKSNIRDTSQNDGIGDIAALNDKSQEETDLLNDALDDLNADIDIDFNDSKDKAQSDQEPKYIETDTSLDSILSDEFDLEDSKDITLEDSIDTKTQDDINVEDIDYGDLGDISADFVALKDSNDDVAPSDTDNISADIDLLDLESPENKPIDNPQDAKENIEQSDTNLDTNKNDVFTDGLLADDLAIDEPQNKDLDVNEQDIQELDNLPQDTPKEDSLTSGEIDEAKDNRASDLQSSDDLLDISSLEDTKSSKSLESTPNDVLTLDDLVLPDDSNAEKEEQLESSKDLSSDMPENLLEKDISSQDSSADSLDLNLNDLLSSDSQSKLDLDLPNDYENHLSDIDSPKLEEQYDEILDESADIKQDVGAIDSTQDKDLSQPLESDELDIGDLKQAGEESKTIFDKDVLDDVNNLLIDTGAATILEAGEDFALETSEDSAQDVASDSALDKDVLSDDLNVDLPDDFVLDSNNKAANTPLSKLPSVEDDINNVSEITVAKALGEDDLLPQDELGEPQEELHGDSQRDLESVQNSKDSNESLDSGTMSEDVSPNEQRESKQKAAQTSDALGTEIDSMINDVIDNDTKQESAQDTSSSKYDTTSVSDVKQMDAKLFIDFLREAPKEKIQEIFKGANVSFTLHFDNQQDSK